MAVLVRIPTVLQQLAGGRREIEIEGETVAQVIDGLEKEAPGFKERLLDEDGKIRRFVNVYVDEEDIRFLDGLSTSIKDGSEVSIIPAVAGGGKVRNKKNAGCMPVRRSKLRI